ncbi:phage virion morphogenesis protein [Desulfurobacterium sp.]
MKGLKRLERALKKFAEKFDKEAAEKIAQHIVSKSVKRIKEGEIKPPTSDFTRSLRTKSGGGTLQDTGALMKSLTYQIEGKRIKIGSKYPYAKAHQFGATIKPRKAKKLCIPASQEMKKLTKTKSVREALHELKNQGYSVWFQGNVIMGKKGKRGKERVLFYLKDEVEIPARTFVYLDEGDWTEITNMVRSWLRE